MQTGVESRGSLAAAATTCGPTFRPTAATSHSHRVGRVTTKSSFLISAMERSWTSAITPATTIGRAGPPTGGRLPSTAIATATTTFTSLTPTGVVYVV